MNPDAAGSYRQDMEKDEVKQGLEDPAPEPNREGSLGEKESPDTAGTNPKRTENSRPD